MCNDAVSRGGTTWRSYRFLQTFPPKTVLQYNQKIGLYVHSFIYSSEDETHWALRKNNSAVMHYASPGGGLETRELTTFRFPSHLIVCSLSINTFMFFFFCSSPILEMSDEAVGASQQNFCDVAEEMTKSMASVRELIQTLRKKYDLVVY